MEELKKAPVTVLLILANILVFTAVEFTGGSEDTMHMLQCGAAYTPAIMQGEYYRIFTSMFLHFGPQHLGNNMLVLFVLGGRLERTVGKLKYLLIYLLGGMGGNLLCLFLELDSADFAVSAGASGAVFAVMGAMIYAVIRGRGSDHGCFFALFWFYKRRSGQCGTCRRSYLWIPACSSALSPFAACRITDLYSGDAGR